MKSFTKMLVLILAIFGFAKGDALAQYAQDFLTVEFPRKGEKDVGLGVGVRIKAKKPYKFRLDKLTNPKRGSLLYWEKRDDGYYGVKGSCTLLYDGFDLNIHSKEFTDSLLILQTYSSLYHNKVYGFKFTNIVLYNEETNDSTTQSFTLDNHFTTIDMDLHYVNNSLIDLALLCNQDLLINFSDDISYIKDIKKLITLAKDTKNPLVYDTLDYTYEFTNDNKTLKINTDFVKTGELYLLNINRHILCPSYGNNYRSYTFVRPKTTNAKVSTYFFSKELDSLLPLDRTITKFLFSTMESNGTIKLFDDWDYPKDIKSILKIKHPITGDSIFSEFVRWDCPEVPRLHNNEDPGMNMQLNCDELFGFNLAPVYREPLYDTLVFDIANNVRVEVETFSDDLENNPAFIIPIDNKSFLVRPYYPFIFSVKLKNQFTTPVSSFTANYDINDACEHYDEFLESGTLQITTYKVKGAERGKYEYKKAIKLIITPHFK